MRATSWELSLHQRLLRRDRTAADDLVAAYLKVLVQELQYRYGPYAAELGTPEAIEDAVIEALVNYRDRPDQYKPSLRSLHGYLKMAAQGDLLNAFKRIRRYRAKEAPFVELPADVRNEEVTGSEDQALDWNERLDRLLDTMPSQRDRDIARLMLQGEFRTKVYAEILGLGHLAFAEQRKVVKRYKDKLHKRMQRHKEPGHAK